MKNEFKALKKFFLSFSAISFICFLSCCSPEDTSIENKSGIEPGSKKEVWAEETQSTTTMIQPLDYEDEYWKSINKNVNHQLIFNSLVNAVISGKLIAYDIITDEQKTVDEVKTLITMFDSADTEKKLDGDDISTIRMREKWVFDQERLKLEKQVNRIDLLYAKYNTDGEYVGDKPLFYVNL